MAKKKRKKNDVLTDSLKLRILMMFILFVVVIATFRLGIIGESIHSLLFYLVGYLAYVLYIIVICVAVYIFYKASLIYFLGPQAIGVDLILLSSSVIISIYHETCITGFAYLTAFLKGGICNGGFVGAFLYSLTSALFDYWGALIFACIIALIGLILLLSKTYIHYQAQLKKKKAKQIQKDEQVKTIVLKKKSHFYDFFSKDQTFPIFPDSAFEDNKEEDIDSEIISAFEFNDEKMQLDIKEPKQQEAPSQKEEEKKLTKSYEQYQLPPLSLLSTQSTNQTHKEKSNASKNAARLSAVLKQFGVQATVENAFIGPTITKYELKLEVGTRVNKILHLQDDIKLALATTDIRIEAPIPGKPYVGIEVPNATMSMVGFKDVLKSLIQHQEFKDNKLVVALGKDVSGQPIFAQLDKMPHLLIAGATGSGKSVCVNTIISSILMRAKPDEVKLILVDPKKVELSIYNGIPHLLAPVVTDPKKAAAVLREVVSEMERRYDLFASVNARNISGYNEFVKSHNHKHPDDLKEVLSYHVVILDEVADLMMVASKDVEDCIMRISQMARAAGIHLIVATQRPSTDIITGVIKANIPSRIAFAVSSSIDSRTILDTSGAEKLLGKGDMLFSPMGSSSPIRIQGAFVSDEEVASIVHYVSSQQKAIYEDKYVNATSRTTTTSTSELSDEEDEEYELCREFVIQSQKASISLLQRKFRIGYNKSARIIERLEDEGVIGPQIGNKPREVYIRQYSEEDL